MSEKFSSGTKKLKKKTKRYIYIGLYKIPIGKNFVFILQVLHPKKKRFQRLHSVNNAENLRQHYVVSQKTCVFQYKSRVDLCLKIFYKLNWNLIASAASAK